MLLILEVAVLCLAFFNGQKIAAQTATPGCVGTTSIGNRLFVLSDDTTDAITAGKKCSDMGGSLAVLKSRTTSRAVEHACKQKYAQGIQTVYVHQNSKGGYRFSLLSHVSKWTRVTDASDIGYFHLYKHYAPDRIRILFCHYNEEKFTISVGRLCEKGWQNDFKMYGSTKDGNNVEKLYLFYQKDYSTRIARQILNQTLNTDHSILAPVVNVIIGARYNVKTKNWRWSDNSRALLALPANRTGCQQAVLHYGSVWTKKSVFCNARSAYYVCQLRFTINATWTKCNPEKTIIKWNRLKLPGNKSAVVEIQTAKDANSYKAIFKPYLKLQANLSDLSPEKQYNITAILYVGTCTEITSNTIRRKKINLKTKPPIVIARVSKFGNCSLEVLNHDTLLAASMSYYKIQEISREKVNSTVVPYVPHQRIAMTVAETSFNKTFQISAINSCGEESNVNLVQGSCHHKTHNTIDSKTRKETPMYVYAVSAAGGFVLIVLFVIGICILVRRSNQSKLPVTACPEIDGDAADKNSLPGNDGYETVDIRQPEYINTAPVQDYYHHYEEPIKVSVYENDKV